MDSLFDCGNSITIRKAKFSNKQVVKKMEIKKLSLVLADISGYTQFLRLHKVSLLHAEQIITELLEAVIDVAEHPLKLNKLEGDAAFLYAHLEDHDVEAAQDIINQVVAFFDSFKTKQQTLINAANGGCPCGACIHIGELRLKAFLHHGQAVIKRIREFEELAGNDVILIHRLLKNSISANEYILMTEKIYELSGGILNQKAESVVEDCEGIGNVRVFVFSPDTKPLDIPGSKPLTRFSGFLEDLRIWKEFLKRRISKPKPVFRNLPD